MICESNWYVPIFKSHPSWPGVSLVHTWDYIFKMCLDVLKCMLRALEQNQLIKCNAFFLVWNLMMFKRTENLIFNHYSDHNGTFLASKNCVCHFVIWSWWWALIMVIEFLKFLLPSETLTLDPSTTCLSSSSRILSSWYQVNSHFSCLGKCLLHLDLQTYFLCPQYRVLGLVFKEWWISPLCTFTSSLRIAPDRQTCGSVFIMWPERKYVFFEYYEILFKNLKITVVWIWTRILTCSESSFANFV